MSTKSPFTLLTLAAFFVLGFSITANAAKPTGEREQSISTPPLGGYMVSCNVTNSKSYDLSPTFEIVDAQGVVLSTWTPVAGLRAYNNAGWGGPINSTSYCRVSWFGLADDIKVAICSYEDDWETLTTCLNGN
jgi:hypothetical protein